MVDHREIVLTLARWFLLANVVAASWLYGGTREWAREWVTWLLLANFFVFVVGITARWRVPRIPLPAALAVLFLLVQGWFMTWNAKRKFLDVAEVFVDREPMFPGWPGFVDSALVMPSMLLTTGLLGAFCIACDLVGNPIWRHRLWVTLAGTGISIVMLGLAQRMTDAPSIFWDLEQNLGWTFFAVYRYHANAGSYINLVLPLMVGLAVSAYLRKGEKKNRVVWTMAALITAAAGFVNVSRAANILCAVLLFLMSFWIALLASDRTTEGRWRIRILICVGMLVVTGVLAFSFGVEKTLRRWESGSWQILSGDDGRAQAYEIMMRSAIPAARAWGFGPGTFERMFNIHREQLGSELQGRWDKGHSDALQTLMEWGWAGGGVWAVLICGGWLRGVRIARQCWSRNRTISIVMSSCAFSLTGVMLHGLVDFPLQIASLQLTTLLVTAILWGSREDLLGRTLKSTSWIARTPHRRNNVCLNSDK